MSRSPNIWVEPQLPANLVFSSIFLSVPPSVFEITIASAKFRDKAAAGMYEDFFGSRSGVCN